jgi:tetratricopeptide (TPR) repeat protein
MSSQAEILRSKAQTLHRQGRRREAIGAYRELLAMQPGLTDCWYNLGYLLKTEGQYDEALDAYSQALAGGVSDAEEVHVNRAVIYSDHLRREDAAEAELRVALTLNPDYVPALLNLGNLCEERGERARAVACYERIVSGGQRSDEHEALALEALGRLTQLRPPSGPHDPLLGQLERAATGVDQLDAVTRANLFFSLGRAYDRLGLYEDAFAAFEHANRHARSAGRAYSRSRARRRTDATMRAFPNTSTNPGAPHDNVAEPLFICGMFRSGSTLIEQALAAHPRVIAGGELDILPRLVKKLRAADAGSLAGPGSQQVTALAGEYRAQLLRLIPEAGQSGTYVTDKRPDNFLRIGLIKRLFPAAKFVHTVRNPLDNCLSIYFQHLDQNAMSYSSDLRDTGHYYGQYRRLMAHWKSLFAQDIFDFSYDKLVREPALQLEKLLAFLELDWDDRCLQFHGLANTVKTASYWQVRRPLYAEASGRWRNYRAHLTPLQEALREADVNTDVR